MKGWLMVVLMWVVLAAAAVGGVRHEMVVRGVALDGWPQLDSGEDGERTDSGEDGDRMHSGGDGGLASSAAAVWDFSRLTAGGRAEGRYIACDDSLTMELMPAMRFDFVTVREGAMVLVCAEGRNWRAAVDSLPVDGRTVRTDSIALSVDLSRRLRLRGLSRQRIDRNQSVVMPAGDTVRNVTLLQIAFEGVCSSLMCDSVSRPMRAVRLYWFAPSREYPMAVATAVDDAALGVYLFDDEEDATDDSANGSADASTTPAVAAVPRSPFADLLRPYALSHAAQADNNTRGKGPTYKNSPMMADADPQVAIAPGAVSVALPAATDASSMMLCDIAGRVFPPSVVSELEARFDALPQGDYILSVDTPRGRWSCKFYIPARQ